MSLLDGDVAPRILRALPPRGLPPAAPPGLSRPESLSPFLSVPGSRRFLSRNPVGVLLFGGSTGDGAGGVGEAAVGRGFLPQSSGIFGEPRFQH